VHVHRGFHGVNEGKTLAKEDMHKDGGALTAFGYDWRNPMVHVVITHAP
jgi:hypothetical protein